MIEQHNLSANTGDKPPSPTSYSESELLARRLYEEFYSPLTAFAERRLGAIAGQYGEDVAQSAIKSFINRKMRGNFPDLTDADIGRMLYTITIRKVINLVRRERLCATVPLLEYDHVASIRFGSTDQNERDDSFNLGAEITDFLEHFLKPLDIVRPFLYECFCLHLKGYTHVEIAEEINKKPSMLGAQRSMKPKNVERLVRKATEILRPHFPMDDLDHVG
jgi:DNA-directed RNA polymerase specialized sigma24 family protein